MRSRLSAKQRRSQLLTVAGELFAAHGYHGLSMEALAEAAGVSKPVLYQHFPSKRDLYLALVEDAVAVMEARVATTLAGTRDNRARLEGAIAVYFAFVEDPRFRLLFATAELNDERVREVVDAAMHRVAERVADLIAEDAGLSPQAALFLATALRGLAAEGARWWLRHPDVDRDEAVLLLSRLAWRGLGSFDAQQPAAVPRLDARAARG